MLRRRLGPMAESWSAMSEMDRERAAADEADRPESATAVVDEAEEDLFHGFSNDIDAADRNR
jgi:hypothetical protein